MSATMMELPLPQSMVRETEPATIVRSGPDEASARRRFATLVAEAAPAEDVFLAVVGDVAGSFPVDLVSLSRFEPDGRVTVLASRPRIADTECRTVVHDVSTLVRESGRPARIDDDAAAFGPGLTAGFNWGARSAVGVPIVIDRRIWGVLLVASRHVGAMPPKTGCWLTRFVELAVAAVANAETRAQLIASHARIVTSAEDARRRIARDLHDAAQQRLVNAILVLKLAQHELADGGPDAKSLVAEGLELAQRANLELGELVHGGVPRTLASGGLAAGIDDLISGLRIPVKTAMPAGRLGPAIESSAYFVIAEALSNIAKHSRACSASVTAQLQDGRLLIEVRDDGVGGAQPDGSGLRGIADRVGAFGGHVQIESQPSKGTSIIASFPLRRSEDA
ncbi:MAG: GAF domain-containing protein [Solirubrobacterales bacterium]|nr:GAF domain-containing protein [Solirubrobacterales bacterium]